MVDTNVGHIVAMGGGGFSMETDNPLLDDYVLGLSRRQPARVCFLPTASGDSATYIAKFYRALSSRCLATDLTLNGSPGLPRQPAHSRELADFVREQDIFYVGGGNTAHLLALWRLHGLDTALRDAWHGGAVLAGLSAGMICWFAASITDSFGGMDALHDGLGLLPWSACPHYDGETERRPTFHDAIANGMPDGYAADDGAALHFAGQNLVEVVSSRPDARAFWVHRERNTSGVDEDVLPTRFLGTSSGCALDDEGPRSSQRVVKFSDHRNCSVLVCGADLQVAKSSIESDRVRTRLQFRGSMSFVSYLRL